MLSCFTIQVQEYFEKIPSNQYLSKRSCCQLLGVDTAVGVCRVCLILDHGKEIGLAMPEDGEMIDPVTFGLNRAPFTLSDGYNYDIHAIVGLVRKTVTPDRFF